MPSWFRSSKKRPHKSLTGDHNTAQELAADKNVDAVTITSSALAGFALQEICARRLVPLQAELSGNNAAIVWDGNLPEAAAQIVRGAFGFAGQRCTANRRVVVNTKHFQTFLAELQRAAGQLAWGDPLDKKTDLGPVIHAAKRDEHAALLLAAQNSAAVSQIYFPCAGHAGKTLVQKRRLCTTLPSSAATSRGIPLVQGRVHELPFLVAHALEKFRAGHPLCNGVRHGLVAALFSRSPRPFRKSFSTKPARECSS